MVKTDLTCKIQLLNPFDCVKKMYINPRTIQEGGAIKIRAIIITRQRENTIELKKEHSDTDQTCIRTNLLRERPTCSIKKNTHQVNA